MAHFPLIQSGHIEIFDSCEAKRSAYTTEAEAGPVIVRYLRFVAHFIRERFHRATRTSSSRTHFCIYGQNSHTLSFRDMRKILHTLTFGTAPLLVACQEKS